MSITITVQQVITGLFAALADRGVNYVYTYPEGKNGCMYAHVNEDGAVVPGCIVGHLLNQWGLLGLVTDGLCTIDNIINGVGFGTLFGPLGELHSAVTFEKGAFKMLEDAQFHQDGGKTWGEAIELAFINGFHQLNNRLASAERTAAGD